MKSKAWRDIWGCGQGIGAIHDVPTAGERIGRLAREYDAACRELEAKTALFGRELALAAE
jgi:nitronate monooxygenase